MLFGQQLKAIPSSRCLLIAYAESEFGVFTPFYIPTKVPLVRHRVQTLEQINPMVIAAYIEHHLAARRPR